jgi:outer membrane protein TolC
MSVRNYLILVFCGLPLIAYNQTHDIDYYLKAALLNSPLVTDYRNQARSASSDSLLIRAERKPQVEARSQLQYSPYYNNFGYDEVVTDGGNYTAVAGITQEILNKAARDNRFRDASLLRQSAENGSRISVRELKKDITAQYLTAFSVYKDLLFNRNFLDLFHKENEIIREFVSNGICKQTDYLSLVVETKSQEILLSQLSGQYSKELKLLNQLCGINDSTWYGLAEPEIVITGTPDITKSPSYVQYKIDSMKIINQKQAVDILYRPKVNWFADMGFLTSNPWNFYRHFGYSAGVSLNIPIYDGKQREIKKQKLEFDENSRQSYRNNFYKQYYQQVNQLDEELKSLEMIAGQTEDQLRTADKLVQALKLQLESGIIQMTEYINAVKNYKTISRTLIIIKIQKLQVINEMNFLMNQ